MITLIISTCVFLFERKNTDKIFVTEKIQKSMACLILSNVAKSFLMI